MKPANVKSGTFIDSDKERNEKEPKFEIGDMQEYKNIKTFLKKFTFQIDQNKFFWLDKLKIMFHGHILSVFFSVKKLLKHFTKKNCQKKWKII